MAFFNSLLCVEEPLVRPVCVCLHSGPAVCFLTIGLMGQGKALQGGNGNSLGAPHAEVSIYKVSGTLPTPHPIGLWGGVT